MKNHRNDNEGVGGGRDGWLVVDKRGANEMYMNE